ncbi:hypothetical protein KEM56_003487 [Ascosphaera pollenicola]|nr:hypothetical protein KEM56_003487 [Ascosphaera pollenicola]
MALAIAYRGLARRGLSMSILDQPQPILARHASTRATLTTTSRQPWTQSRPLPRLFSTSPPTYKKKGGGSSNGGKDKASSSSAVADDAADLGFAELQKSLDDALARMKDDIAKLRTGGTGGRFNPALIEQLRVPIDKSTKKDAAQPRLGDLAQVIPKGGRTVAILLGDETHAKPISSAIASSNLSLNAQQDPHNPLQLTVPIPPPTRESRDAAVKEAKAAMEKATQGIKNARAATNKRIKEMGQKKRIQPDALHAGLKEMERMVQAGTRGVREAWEAAQRGNV